MAASLSPILENLLKLAALEDSSLKDETIRFLKDPSASGLEEEVRSIFHTPEAVRDPELRKGLKNLTLMEGLGFFLFGAAAERQNREEAERYLQLAHTQRFILTQYDIREPFRPSSMSLYRTGTTS